MYPILPANPKTLCDRDAHEGSTFEFRDRVPMRQPITGGTVRGYHTSNSGETRRGPGPICAVVAATMVILGGCSDPQQAAEQNRHFGERRILNGDAAKGRELIAAVGCGTCHTIPGVPGAVGIVGPPLNRFAKRTYIAGAIPNEPAALVAWVRDAPSLVRQTAMPPFPLSYQEAVHIAAYLYTLRK